MKLIRGFLRHIGPEQLNWDDVPRSNNPSDNDDFEVIDQNVTTNVPRRRARRQPKNNSHPDRLTETASAPLDGKEPAPPPFRIITPVYEAIRETLNWRGLEQAGVLFGPVNSDIVTHFVPDENGTNTSASFELAVDHLNPLLADYRDCGLAVLGLVHSQPPHCTVPSLGDLEYVARLFACPKNATAADFYMPIVCDGDLHPYIIRRDNPGNVLRAELVLL